MKKNLLIIVTLLIVSGCAYTQTNVAAFSLKRHYALMEQEKNTVVIEVPGSISKAQQVARIVANNMKLKEHNVSERKDGFIFFSNTKFGLSLGQGFSKDASNSLGIFFYYYDEDDVTEIVITEYMPSGVLFNKQLRDQMADLIVEYYG